MLPTDSLVEALGSREGWAPLRLAGSADWQNLDSAAKRWRLCCTCRNERSLAARKNSGSRPMNRTGYYGWPESALRQWPHWEAKKSGSVAAPAESRAW